MDFYNNKKYLQAIDRFQRVRTEFPFAPEVTLAELRLAETYYLNKQYAEAIAAFKEFQAMHPNNEHVPFVVYHLGLSHLDQFTAPDRDQKMTELAKGYFETVIKDHSSSPYAPLAQEKLEQCVEHLAEQEFMVASFYLGKEKYPAARERLEGILRRYGNTPTAVKALYHLGEAYRLEKNTVKAALAYSAFVQRYPENPLAQQAQVHLAAVMQEKQDPLALLLMRDGRPAPAQPPASETAENRPAMPTNFVAKKDVVYEEPDEKGLVRRVVDKINPFASADKPNTPKSESTGAKITKVKKDAAKENEPGFFSSVWRSVNPFAKSEKSQVQATRDPQLTKTVDSALTQKGIQPTTETLIAPAADLPQIATEPLADPAAVQNVLRDVDTKIGSRNGTVAGLPAPPEAHPAFNDPATKKKLESATATETQATPSAGAAAILGSVDEKLKRQGIDPTKTEMPVPAQRGSGSQVSGQSASAPERNQKVELDTRLPAEKGPLFLGAGDPQSQGKPEEQQKIEDQKEEQLPPSTDPAQQLPQNVFKGPRIKETPLDSGSGQKEDSGPLQGALDQLKKDAEGLEKVFNPFAW
jgi:outer membrane protein assembly factor BamD